MESTRLEDRASDPIGLQFAKIDLKDLKMSLQRKLLGGRWGALGALWEPCGSLWVPKWRPGAIKEDTKDFRERFCGHLENHGFTKEKPGFLACASSSRPLAPLH